MRRFEIVRQPMVCEAKSDADNHASSLTRLVEANNAGAERASECTLILADGNSGTALALAGLEVVGKDYFGVFPLSRKLLNVREATLDQVKRDQEIQNIQKIMGFQYNKEYTSTHGLRYGRLMIMTSQDSDGFHFKGLLINFLDYLYPSLLKLPEFVVDFVTPIVQVTSGQEQRDFLTIPEYERGLEETPGGGKWIHKYFKGLKTFSEADARYYFRHMERYMIPFSLVQEGDKELLGLAFSADKADDRREWLRRYKPGTHLERQTGEVSLSDFINKELILFFIADNNAR